MATAIGPTLLLETYAIDSPRFQYDPLTGQPAGLLIEAAATNLFTRSEEIDNAAWTKNNSTVSANVAVSPSGTSTADKLIESATTGVHYIHQTLTPALDAYTISVFAKAAERRYLWINVGVAGGGRYSFDLQTGQLASGNVPAAQASIVNVGNGWFRCSLTATATATTAAQMQIGIDNDADASTVGSSSVNYAGDGTSGLLIWGAQLERAGAASSYIKTTTAAVARAADYATAYQPATTGTFAEEF